MSSDILTIITNIIEDGQKKRFPDDATKAVWFDACKVAFQLGINQDEVINLVTDHSEIFTFNESMSSKLFIFTLKKYVEHD